MTCRYCDKFSKCFDISTKMIGINPEKVTEAAMTKAQNIEACPDFETTFKVVKVKNDRLFKNSR